METLSCRLDQSIAGRCDPAANDDPFRCKDLHQRCEPKADELADRRQRRNRGSFTILGRGYDLTWRSPFSTLRQRGRTGDGLQTPACPARAQSAAGLDDDVANVSHAFSGEAQQSATDDYSAADACAEYHSQHV